MDKLSGLGLVKSSLQGSRPYSRLEAARLTAEARTTARHDSCPPAVVELLGRLEAELHEQLVELGFADGATPASYLKPLRGIEARYLYQQGENSLVPGTNASQFALNYNNFGIDYEENHNGQLTFEGDARLGGVFLLHWQPLLLVGEEEDAFRLLHGTAALALGPVELSAGRQSLWWGQGRHGSLVLTNNAKPLDMVRITNPSPVLLPWVLRYLGPFRFDFFVSRLEEDRAVPEPYFGGLRLNFKPLPWLEFGASRTAMIGGEGRPDVDFDDLLTVFGGENLSGNDDTSNSVAALDARIRLAALGGAELYGEYGGEDEAGGFLSNRSFLCGLYLPRLDSAGRLALRLEYADLTHIDSNSPIWYRHGIYLSGYTYEGKIMGHHVGGGAEDLFAELEVLLPADLTVRLSYNHENRGVDQVEEERHQQAAVDVEWTAWPRFSVRVAYAFDRVDNADFISGQERDLHLTEVMLQGRW